jgi:hypothetical protein
MPQFLRVAEFDVWRPGYAGATVEIVVAGTTTLASVYTDPLLSVPAANPQILATFSDSNGRTYGRFANPIYVGVPYQLIINDEGSTGIEQVPLAALDGADVSLATVVSSRAGSVARTLRLALDDTIPATAFGPLVFNSPSNNTATLTAAIAAAAADGGGVVLVPKGIFDLTALSLPQGVRLRGAGRGTTELRSTQGQAVVTMAGANAGLEDLTLSGFNAVTNSIGIRAINKANLALRNVAVTAFATGLHISGGDGVAFEELHVSACTRGAYLVGELLPGQGGAALRSLEWRGGSVASCINAGLVIEAVDAEAQNLVFEQVYFDANAADAVTVIGGRSIMFPSCFWRGNLANLRIEDGANQVNRAVNTSRSVRVLGGRMDGGEVRFNGECRAVVFDNTELLGVSLIASVPAEPIIFRDCFENAAVQQTGAVERISRIKSNRRGRFRLTTTNNTAAAAWQIEVPPGDVVRIRADLVGRRMNGTDNASGAVEGVVTRPGAALDFSSASTTLTAGSTVTGATSGATAKVIAVSQTGAAGTVTLRDVVGTFQAGESLVFSGGPTATAASSIVTSNAALAISAAGVAASLGSYAVAVDASGALARVMITGAAGHTVEWEVMVDFLMAGLR